MSSLVSCCHLAFGIKHLDGSFVGSVKAYIRKANILHAMRDYSKALEALQEASEQDTDYQHRKEISQTELKIQQAIFSQQTSESQEETLQRAMRDPEVAVCFCPFTC